MKSFMVKWKKPSIGALVFFISSYFVANVVEYIFTGNDARGAYAFLSSYGFAFLICYVCNIKIRAMAPLLVLFMLGALFDTVLGTYIFTHPNGFDFFYLLTTPLDLFPIFIFLASPIIIYAAVCYGFKKFRNKVNR